MPATVAPLGTALTEDQLALLWKMADEPVLCFDGDNAGLRAAYRAVDLALPRLAPGKSLQFALLPEGQDPDDLVRSGGREAIAEVIAAARPLADMLWARETEGHRSTRRSGAPRSKRASTRSRPSIGDDSVRKYYRQDFAARIAPAFRAGARPARHLPAARARAATGNGAIARNGRMAAGRNGFCAARPKPGSRNTPYVVVSQQLAASPLHRGARTSVPRREALILQAALNHPWLLHDHLEEFSQLEFRHPDAERSRAR